MSFLDREFGIKGQNPWDKAQNLRYALKRAIASKPADALLLSGGVDSSMLASLDPQTPAITVVLEGRGPDLKNAQRVVERYGIPWYPVQISTQQAMNDLQEVILLTKNYDPGIKNDVAIYEGLKQAASLGYRTIRTGDSADEWFAGYSFLHQSHIDLKQWVNGLIPHIRLPASRLARAMGLQISYPYLHPEVLELAQTYERDDIIARLDLGPGDYAQLLDPSLVDIDTWGKIPLRNSAYGYLPPEITWRMKMAIEFGSGMDEVERILKQNATPREIRQMRRSKKRFLNVYHGKLYLMYRDMGLEPEAPKQGEYPCGWCGGGVIENRSHCSTCGGYPSDIRSRRIFQTE